MTIQDLSSSLADLVERLSAHVVRIQTPRGHGISGVLYDDQHLITSSRALRRDEGLRGSFGDDEVELELVGRDPGTDLALLRFDQAQRPASAAPPTWSRDAVRVGELAVTLARPGRSVRAHVGIHGVVSGPYRGAYGAEIDRYLELDRELPRGFAGGLVASVQGHATGLVTPGILRSVTVTLPSFTIARVVTQLLQHGHVPRGYLGVGVYPAHLPVDVAKQTGQDRGVAVVALEEDGPASKAGVVVGDIITLVEAQRVSSPLSLRAALVDRGGATLSLRVLRGGNAEDVQVTVGSRS